MIHLIRNCIKQYLPVSQKTRLEWFPPFSSLGVKVVELQDDWSKVRLKLPLSYRTRNPGGTMFGGAQAAVADPVAGLACARRFPAYIVWTKDFQIDFLRPGTTDLELRFEFDEALSQLIADELGQFNKSTQVFEYGFYLPDGAQCSQVKATIAIRPENYRGFRGAVKE